MTVSDVVNGYICFCVLGIPVGGFIGSIYGVNSWIKEPGYSRMGHNIMLPIYVAVGAIYGITCAWFSPIIVSCYGYQKVKNYLQEKNNVKIK